MKPVGFMSAKLIVTNSELPRHSHVCAMGLSVLEFPSFDWPSKPSYRSGTKTCSNAGNEELNSFAMRQSCGLTTSRSLKHR